MIFFFFFQAEDGIRDYKVTGVQTCALPIYVPRDLLGSELGVARHHRQLLDMDRGEAVFGHYPLADQDRVLEVEPVPRHEGNQHRSEEHTSELQSPCNLVCRLLLEKKKKQHTHILQRNRSN